MGEVVEIPGRKTDWDPSDVLAVAARQPWELVCVVGMMNEGEVFTFNSGIDRQTMLWLAENLRILAMSPPDEDE